MRLDSLRTLCLSATLACGAPAQDPGPRAERRIALVIGNGAYPDAPLRNPTHDAADMAEALKRCGFEVARLENGNREQMFAAIRAFGQDIAGGGVGLFYFAGHGLQVKGRNYLIPIGADIRMEDEVLSQALEVDAVLAKMESARNRLNILILDACRNNPFRSFRSLQQGLAQMDAPVGSFVAFATAPGRTAADGSGRNGIYTEALLRHLSGAGTKLEDVFKRTRAEVLRASGGQQVPWENSSIVGDFYFSPGSATTPIEPIAAVPPPATAATPVEARAQPWTNSLGMSFVPIPAGRFTMGSLSGKGSKDEHPQHEVTLAKPFFMASKEVTRAQYGAVMGTAFDPKWADVPAGMTWRDARTFVERLNAREGTTVYRMPSEAEWEYACRAGSTTDWCFGNDSDQLKDYAWYHNILMGTKAVGQKKPNAWGLYDVHGNAWEWCEDRWHDDYVGAPTDGRAWIEGGDPKRRVSRGGSFVVAARFVRSAYREKWKEDSWSWEFGLRLVAIRKP